MAVLTTNSLTHDLYFTVMANCIVSQH